MIKLSDYLFNRIADYGVKSIFMISGGGNMHLIDSVGVNKKLKYICNHNEQASAIAAEGYARVKNGLGVCLVTTGPGGTNTITGVLGSWLDSIPVLYISGQVKRSDMADMPGLRQLGVQEAPIVDMIRPITKYAVTITDPLSVGYHLDKAIDLAMSGRMGPVWLDIPLDVQAAMIDERKLAKYVSDKEKGISDNELTRAIKRVINMIENAERPIILAGHGIRLSGAGEAFMNLIARLNIPVVTSMGGTDTIPSNNRLFIGRIGSFGNRSGNFAIQNSDLIISLGARMHLWNIGYDYKNFGREAKKIVVDIDPCELNKKTISPDLKIQVDVAVFIKKLLTVLGRKSISSSRGWRDRCSDWKKRYPVVLPEYAKEKKFVNSYYFTEVLSSLLESDDIIVTGNGTAFTGTIQAINIKKGQRFHCNVGCASMGYDLPAAIGASIATGGKKRIILVTGDGSIMMNLQELQTIYHYKLPIIIFLLNNEGYLAIRNTQASFFKNRFVASEKNSGVSFPDFKDVAKTFKLKYVDINNHSGLKAKIAAVLSSKRPILCNLKMNPMQPLYPKGSSKKNPDGSMTSKPIEDMYPFLDRAEFLADMIIKPINFD